jgi:hypothetical protein
MAKKKKRLGKNQVDIEPIGVAIREVQGRLKALKGLSAKQQRQVNKRLQILDALYAGTSAVCCDEQWFCPCPEEEMSS